MQAILTTHLVFNLREVSLTSNTSNSQQNKGANLPGFSQVDFARSIFGNLGAPLDLSAHEDTYESDSNDDFQGQELARKLESRSGSVENNQEARGSSLSTESHAQPQAALGGRDDGYVCYDGKELLVFNMHDA